MSAPTAKEIAAEYKAMDDGELTDIYRELDIPGNMSPVDEIKRIKAESERLRAALKGSAEQITKLAFAMAPPNAYTPQFVMIAQSMVRAVQQNKQEPTA